MATDLFNLEQEITNAERQVEALHNRITRIKMLLKMEKLKEVV